MDDVVALTDGKDLDAAADKYGKFIHFRTWTSDDGKKRLEPEHNCGFMDFFSNKLLTRTRISKCERRDSLRIIINCLRKLVDKEVESEMASIKKELREKKSKFRNIDELEQRLWLMDMEIKRNEEERLGLTNTERS